MNNPPKNPTPGKPPATPPGTPNLLDKTRWFKDEVHAHDAKLKSYLRGLFPTIDVDDVVQESYLRTWIAAKPVTSAKAFLFTVARRLAIDSVRTQKKSPITDTLDLAALNVADQGRNAAETAAINDEIALLTNAIDSLPPRCREIILLRKIQNFSQRDVAAMLSITEDTVEEQVYRGIRRMEEFLVKRGVTRPWHNARQRRENPRAKFQNSRQTRQMPHHGKKTKNT